MSMTTKLIFATNNKHKLREATILSNGCFPILSLEDIDYDLGEIPEDFETLEENALQKVHFIADKFNVNCFSDDTGLEVEALGGAPGVYSARYAGKNCSFQQNIDKLLDKLKNEKNRNARFRTVIALILNGEEYLFEGVVNGKITTQNKGTGGFGYDPIFIPDNYSQTFAELPLEEKNKISHRGLALQKLFNFLMKDYQK